MVITETGNGLKLLIKCNYLAHHDWMAFSSWYSVTKNLPDAQVFLYCDKSLLDARLALFRWVRKVGVQFSYKRPDGYDIEIFCDTMALRTWTSSEVGDAKANDALTFYTYKNGCGNFVMADWINNIVPPFIRVEEFKKDGMSINEQKILELWNKVSPVYAAIV